MVRDQGRGRLSEGGPATIVWFDLCGNDSPQDQSRIPLGLRFGACPPDEALDPAYEAAQPGPDSG